MKKKLFIFTLCVMMIFASTITCFAYDAGYSATRYGLTTSDGRYLEFPASVQETFKKAEDLGVTFNENKYFINKAEYTFDDEGVCTYGITFYPDDHYVGAKMIYSSNVYRPTLYYYNATGGTSTKCVRVTYHYNTNTDTWSFDSSSSLSQNYVQVEPKNVRGYTDI